MLVLSRKEGECVRIGKDIFVAVISINGKTVRLGFKAPDQIAIMREEIKNTTGASPVVAWPVLDSPDRLG